MIPVNEYGGYHYICGLIFINAPPVPSIQHPTTIIQRPMHRLTWLFLLAVVLLGSCVANKKIQYFQQADVNVKELPIDSTVRSYSISLFDYKVQPQDALFIRFDSPTNEQFNFLSSDQQANVNVAQAANLLSELVDDQGEVYFPVIGKVKVAGLSVFEIEEKLQGLANQYLEAVKVKVRLVNFRFTVLGEVRQEGSVTTFNNRVSLPEAIGLAGGIDELADRSRVKIIRQNGNKVDIAYINLLEEGFINSPYYYLHQNDILVVPPLKQRPFRRYFGQNLSLFLSSVSLLLIVINLTE